MHNVDTEIRCDGDGIHITVKKDGREYEYHLESMDKAKDFFGEEPIHCPIVRDMIEAGMEEQEAGLFVVDMFKRLAESMAVAELKFLLGGLLGKADMQITSMDELDLGPLSILGIGMKRKPKSRFDDPQARFRDASKPNMN